MPIARTLVKTEYCGGVATLTLTRPEKLNALTSESFAELHDALTEIAETPECRVVIFTGAGSSFCAGLDLKTKFGGAWPGVVQDTYAAMRRAAAVIMLLRDMPQPVIAAVQGNAVGAGFAFAAACDLRVVGHDAVFNPVFTKIGMSPGDLGLSWFLPRIIGPTAAAELFYLADTMDADRAKALGFANHVEDDPLTKARELAQKMVARSPMGMRQAKELLNASLGAGGFRQHLEIELRSQVICSMTADHAEAKLAFGEGRTPVFTDT